MKSKIKIKSIEELVTRINTLKKEIDERQSELNDLMSIQLPFDAIGSSEPAGFDYKDAILEIFQERPSGDALKVDDLVSKISSKYKFTPDRETVALRTTYLVDNAKKLERATDRPRGFYRLKTNNPYSYEQGLG